VSNTVLSRLRIVRLAWVGMAISMRGGKLRYVWVDFGNGPTYGTSAVEWFVPDPARRFHVVHNHKPWGAHVEFSSDLPESQRVKAFGFNVNCLVKPWNCDKAEDVLPGVWQLDAAPQ